MKQLLPTSIEEYIAERREGDVVSGRVTEVSGEQVSVELGEGIHGTCRIAAERSVKEKTQGEAKADLASLSSRLMAHWKGGDSARESEAEALRAGQVRSFRISKLDPAAKKIELDLA